MSALNSSVVSAVTTDGARLFQWGIVLKLYRRWSRSGRPDDQKKFLDKKHLVRRIIDRAYEKYLKDILAFDLEAPPKVKTKKLFSLLK